MTIAGTISAQNKLIPKWRMFVAKSPLMKLVHCSLTAKSLNLIQPLDLLPLITVSLVRSTNGGVVPRDVRLASQQIFSLYFRCAPADSYVVPERSMPCP